MPRRWPPLSAVRHLSRRTRLLALASAGVAVAALGVVPLALDRTDEVRMSEVRAAGPQLTVATWNMCDVRQWGCEQTGTGEEKLEALAGLVRQNGARVLLLQEVCSKDLEAARQQLGPDVWHLAFQPYRELKDDHSTSLVPCANAEQGEAGFGILAASTLSNEAVLPVPQPDPGLQRGILCVTVDGSATGDGTGPVGTGLRVCNAHLSLPPDEDEDEYRDDQLAALARAVAGRTAVFGGDFNSSPPGADESDRWIWPNDYYNRYRECDQSSPGSLGGRPTHDSGHKLDYLFTGLPRRGCEVRDTGRSDHSALVMKVAAAG